MIGINFKLPFQEQIDFFRQKLNLPTEHYDDILKSAHDRAFIVAGASKADLLNDFRLAVDQAIKEGKSLGWFRKEFDGIVEKHGWQYNGSRDWRSRVIYRTNMAASYSAGRHKQMTDPALLKRRPYWKYVHNDTVEQPRPLHVEWSGLVLKWDDPWWDTHYPPNGWGCRCRVVPVRPKEYTGDTAPDDGTYTYVDRFGEQHVIPKGIDYGWDYKPGDSIAALLRRVIDKQEGASWQLARDNVAALVASDYFVRFFNSTMDGEFPIAVLDDAEKRLLGSESQIVLLSRESINDHVEKHPDISISDYRNVQEIIDKGEIYAQDDRRFIYLWLNGELYRAALKRSNDRLKNYFLTLFKTNDKKADQDVRRRFKRVR